MLCYKDKTFCKSDCVNESCTIRLTEKIIKEAEAFGLPTSHADFSKGCYDYESLRKRKKSKKVSK